MTDARRSQWLVVILGCKIIRDVIFLFLSCGDISFVRQMHLFSLMRKKVICNKKKSDTINSIWQACHVPYISSPEFFLFAPEIYEFPWEIFSWREGGQRILSWRLGGTEGTLMTGLSPLPHLGVCSESSHVVAGKWRCWEPLILAGQGPNLGPCALSHTLGDFWEWKEVLLTVPLRKSM